MHVCVHVVPMCVHVHMVLKHACVHMVLKQARVYGVPMNARVHMTWPPGKEICVHGSRQYNRISKAKATHKLEFYSDKHLFKHICSY